MDLADRGVLEYAIQHKLIILTFDRDYGELLFKYLFDPPPAIVYFRYKGNTPETVSDQLLNLIELENIEILGNFAVVEQHGIRQRKL